MINRELRPGEVMLNDVRDQIDRRDRADRSSAVAGIFMWAEAGCPAPENHHSSNLLTTEEETDPSAFDRPQELWKDENGALHDGLGEYSEPFDGKESAYDVAALSGNEEQLASQPGWLSRIRQMGSKVLDGLAQNELTGSKFI